MPTPRTGDRNAAVPQILLVPCWVAITQFPAAHSSGQSRVCRLSARPDFGSASQRHRPDPGRPLSRRGAEGDPHTEDDLPGPREDARAAGIEGHEKRDPAGGDGGALQPPDQPGLRARTLLLQPHIDLSSRPGGEDRELHLDPPACRGRLHRAQCRPRRRRFLAAARRRRRLGRSRARRPGDQHPVEADVFSRLVFGDQSVVILAARLRPPSGIEAVTDPTAAPADLASVMWP